MTEDTKTLRDGRALLDAGMAAHVLSTAAQQVADIERAKSSPALNEGGE